MTKKPLSPEETEILNSVILDALTALHYLKTPELRRAWKHAMFMANTDFLFTFCRGNTVKPATHPNPAGLRVLQGGAK